MARYEVHRTDANAPLLYDAARKMGMQVHVINRPVDALVGMHGFTVAVEVKTDTGKLRPDQEAFLRDWKGDAEVWRSIEDVMATRKRLQGLADQIGGRGGSAPVTGGARER